MTCEHAAEVARLRAALERIHEEATDTLQHHAEMPMAVSEMTPREFTLFQSFTPFVSSAKWARDQAAEALEAHPAPTAPCGGDGEAREALFQAVRRAQSSMTTKEMMTVLADEVFPLSTDIARQRAAAGRPAMDEQTRAAVGLIREVADALTGLQRDVYGPKLRAAADRLAAGREGPSYADLLEFWEAFQAWLTRRDEVLVPSSRTPTETRGLMDELNAAGGRLAAARARLAETTP